MWPHPNLLKADGVTEINGQLMLILDYAETGNLRELFVVAQRRNTWMPLEVTLHLAQQIATGLVILHTPAPDFFRPYPIVHRDLKPENILLDRVWARITDFGLAKAVSDVTTATTVGALLGTPAYMAPEQWLDASQAGMPADAYAFGLIVAELLSGRHPLLPLDQPHTLDDWRQAHQMGQPMPLRQLGSDVLAAERASRNAGWGARQQAALEQIEGLVTRLLAKQEATRPTMADALVVLQAAARTLGEKAYTPADVYPPTEEHQAIFWQGWAQAYYHFGLHTEALSRIERALTLAPQHWGVLSTYANILTGLRRGEEALVVYQQALAQLPVKDWQSRTVIWSNTGDCLIELKRYSSAADAYTEALRLAPVDPSIWSRRAYLAWLRALSEQAAGQVESARAQVDAGLAHIAEALRLNPDHPNYLMAEQNLLQLRELLRGQE